MHVMSSARPSDRNGEQRIRFQRTFDRRCSPTDNEVRGFPDLDDSTVIVLVSCKRYQQCHQLQMIGLMHLECKAVTQCRRYGYNHKCKCVLRTLQRWLKFSSFLATVDSDSFFLTVTTCSCSIFIRAFFHFPGS